MTKYHSKYFAHELSRRVYDDKSETWLCSVVDIIVALIQQLDYQAAESTGTN